MQFERTKVILYIKKSLNCG